ASTTSVESLSCVVPPQLGSIPSIPGFDIVDGFIEHCFIEKLLNTCFPSTHSVPSLSPGPPPPAGDVAHCLLIASWRLSPSIDDGVGAVTVATVCPKTLLFLYFRKLHFLEKTKNG